MNYTNVRKRALYGITALLLFSFSLLMLVSGKVSAAQLTARDLVLGSSVASAATTYQFDFTTGQTATIQSFSAQVCTNASGSCSTPAGFTVSGSTFNSTTFSGSWSVNTSTAGSLRGTATGATSTSTGVPKQVIFGNVTNPNATNATFYVRLTTYSDTGWVTPVDTGVVASSTAGQVTVTASVDESLTFTLAAQTAALGALTASTTGSATSTMSAATNATSGYSVTVNGNTLTSGANTIAALASQTASSQGSSQFGINLKANATPSVGADPSGGTGAATSNYGTADQYRFVTGDSVASAAGPSNTTSYTVSYVANIANTTKPGSYSTLLTYIATTTF
jgi:hypothetical protein